VENTMSAKEEMGKLTATVKEVTQTHLETHNDTKQSIKATQSSTGSVNNLSKSTHKNYLIKAGVALLVFPEPIVSDILGTTLIAAGAIQEGIRRNSIYIDDLPKSFKSAMRDLRKAKELI
jgi:hypothetical protein